MHDHDGSAPRLARFNPGFLGFLADVADMDYDLFRPTCHDGLPSHRHVRLATTRPGYGRPVGALWCQRRHGVSSFICANLFLLGFFRVPLWAL